MKISNQAIDHPRVIFVLTLLTLFLAFLAASRIPVQRTPAITTAVVLVAIPYPDARPEESENEVTRKIEEALSGLENVDFLASTSTRGSSVTQVLFLDGVDPDQARVEVQDLVERVRNELPAGREVQPVVTDISFENTPLLLVTITGPENFDQRALKEVADAVRDDLAGVDGVSNTQLFGGMEREIHVNVDPDVVNQYGLTLADLRQALAGFHAEIPGGSLNTGTIDASIRSEAKLRDPDDIREVIIRQVDGRLIRIDDVAEVVDTHRRLRNVSQLDGQNCATIIVNKRANINTWQAAGTVKQRVEVLKHQYPQLTFSVTRDTSEEISYMFRVLGSSALFGAMLVLIILAWSMGLRISILVLTAIPFSMAIALIFLFFANIPVSNMVIFSFILVLGMVVDGAIIVAENIHRHVERGEDPVTAAKTGIAEVGMPVIAADLTTVAAFMPMLIVPGLMGDFMGVMPKVVSVALIGSVLVDHLLIPTLAACWYRQREPAPADNLPFAAIADTSLPATTAPTYRIRPNLGLFTRGYVTLLRAALGNRWFCVAICVWAVFGAGVLYKRIGFIFFPGSDRGQFQIHYELPLGYSIEQTIAAASVITEPLAELIDTGEMVHFVSAIGSSEGLASRLETDPASGPEFGTVMVQLTPPLDRDRHVDEIVEQLREKVHPLPGMNVRFELIEEGPPGGSDVAIRLTGKDLDQLGNLSEMLVRELRQIPGTVDVASTFRPANPELVIEPIPEVVGLFGMTEAQVARTVQTAIAGDQQIQITMNDEDVTVRLQLAPEYQRHPDDLRRLMITSPTGRQASIGQLADLRRSTGLYSINRYNHSRAVTARCNVMDPVRPDDVFKVLREKVLPQMGYEPLPRPGGVGVMAIAESAAAAVGRWFGSDPKKAAAISYVGAAGMDTEGTRATFTGENDERDEGFAYMTNSMVIGVVLIFGILVYQFNSFRQAVVVLVSVPLSFIGVVIGMWLCSFPFSLASFIGLVSLTGIVVNDAIVMVDFTNQARRRGLPTNDALLEAGINRLRPVCLTTVTTIGGLLPLFLNIAGAGEFWQPLTGAVIFGLAFATLLTLVVIPVGYSLAYTLSDGRPATEMTKA